MTDQEPDDLYNALRDRLADYGQAPPAHLWAGIQQQLATTPAAAPRRRKRWHWGAGAVLAVLLMAVAVRYWPRATRATIAAATHPQAKKAAVTSKYSSNKLPTAEQDATTDLAVADTPQSTSNKVTSATTTVGPSAASTTILEDENFSTAESGAAKAPVVVAKATGKVTNGAKKIISAPLAAVDFSEKETKNQSRKARVLWAASTKLTADKPNDTASKRLALVTTQNDGPQNTQRIAVHTKTWHHPTRTIAATKSAREVSKPAYHLPTVVATQPFAADRRTVEGGEKSRATEPQQNLSSASASTSHINNTANTANSSKASALKTTAWDHLPTLPIALQPAAAPIAEAPQAISVKRSPPPVPLGSRWAVQVLAGPALTYRHLGTAPQMAGNVPTVSSGNVAELERPAPGAGALLSIRRTLNSRWNVSAGLGYAEYATRLSVQKVTVVQSFVANTPQSMVPGSDSNSTTFHRRDTYRFLTVPLRVGYAWAPSGRWRLGMLAGADAAFYLGGSTTEGSSCVCQSQAWGATGSPYRTFSLGASLGAEARYRVAEHWELLAQPTATYLLTSLARSDSDYRSRYLFGGAMLLGISYDLH